jgi:hypothetical protein
MTPDCARALLLMTELDVCARTLPNLGIPQRKPKQAEVYEMKSNWGYIRHHK